MLDTYSNTITVDGTVADDTFRARVTGCLLGLPSRPVKVTGGPGTDKRYQLEQAVRACGYPLVLVNVDTLRPYDSRYIQATKQMQAGPCALIIDQAETLDRRPATEREELVEALRQLADHPAVAVTFVVETRTPVRR